MEEGFAKALRICELSFRGSSGACKCQRHRAGWKLSPGALSNANPEMERLPSGDRSQDLKRDPLSSKSSFCMILLLILDLSLFLSFSISVSSFLSFLFFLLQTNFIPFLIPFFILSRPSLGVLWLKGELCASEPGKLLRIPSPIQSAGGWILTSPLWGEPHHWEIDLEFT